MFSKICPVCKNVRSVEKKYENDASVMHGACDKEKTSRKKNRPFRTSTPVAELETSSAPSFSDSVTDFFYQSWKSGLHIDDTLPPQIPRSGCHYQPVTVVQPICYATHVVYVNTVIFQPYIPPFSQQVGYRPDGTFGVLPAFWTPAGN